MVLAELIAHTHLPGFMQDSLGRQSDWMTGAISLLLGHVIFTPRKLD
jgi:hypothetical protein